jgi:LysR family glycine cleavage system transcriptional activator
VKRTHLPLNALRVFDAAARHLSFTKAADELAVTPAAVGQQIRALEETLGVVLFRRLIRNLELTPEAERSLPALRAGFLQFEEAVRVMQEGQASKVLSIGAPRALLSRWLAARLADYGAANPDLRFVLQPADDLPDFTQANLDLALCWRADAPDAEGLHARALGDETMVAVARPGAGDGAARIAWPGDGWEGEGLRGPDVADMGLALDAALAGLGQARVPMLIAAADIAAGRLAPLGEPAPAPARWWLTAPTPQWRQAKVRSLVEFLLG